MSDKSASEISPIMRRLSSYIASALRRPLPPTVVEKTKHHMLDTIAAIVSGSRLEPGKKAIGYLRTVEHPSEGRIKVLAVPSEWSDSAPEYRRHAPRLGEHTREVLAEAGLPEDKIAELTKSL